MRDEGRHGQGTVVQGTIAVPAAALFVAFLDRRTSLPVVHDLRFHLQLYRAALEKPWCRDGDDHAVEPYGLDDCGLDDPLLVHVTRARPSASRTRRSRR